MTAEGEPTEHRSDSGRFTESRSEDEVEVEEHRPPDREDEGNEADDDGFGDDFDDFEEGEEVEGDDFGDFGETEEAEPTPTPIPRNEPPALIDPLADLVSTVRLSGYCGS